MNALKLVALDSEDLDVVSAHLQDAVLKVADIKWLPGEHRFVVAMNRFAWEEAERNDRGKGFERRRSALHFDRVRKVQANRIDQRAKDTVLELLAIRFTETDAPAGHVELQFAGGGTLRLEVECLEAQLSDLGAAWETKARPNHELD